MSPTQRVDLARRANMEANLARPTGAPVLTSDSTIEQVAAWLQWNDPNGCHTAELAAAEGFDPYASADDVWEALDQMLAD